MSDSLRETAGSAETEPDFDAVVIGAGFAGLGMLHRLRESGLTARVFEAASDVGGTWYWNRYPGAACDSMSHVYSFAFSDELLQEWSWSTRYPKQPEVLKYLGYVADRFDLRRDIQLNTRVTSAVFHDAENCWHVETDDGATTTARFLITGVGCLSTAQIPDFPGRDSFQGDTYHTGQWPHEKVDFTGKRVAVIGTGSSGIQIIPEIAQEAEHLTVFQRTANYSIPARNAPLDPEWEAEIKTQYRDLREQTKHTPTGNLFWLDERSALEVPAEERQRQFQKDWDDGGFKLLFGGYHDLVATLEANATVAEFVQEKIREVVEDPATAEKLVPTDHPIGTKRPPLDAGYFETYNRDNVTLVSLKFEPLQAITERGIRTSAGEYEFDAIIFATGFDAMTGALFSIDIRTDAGLELKDKWKDGPRTYLGVASAGFPNLFTITGPGSPSVLSNMPVSIEQHIEWIGDFLDFLRAHELDRVEAEVEAEEEWTTHVRETAAGTLLPLANSWYVGANTPGKPRVVFPYAGGVGAYRERCSEIAADGYPGFKATSTRVVGAT